MRWDLVGIVKGLECRSCGLVLSIIHLLGFMENPTTPSSSANVLVKNSAVSLKELQRYRTTHHICIFTVGCFKCRNICMLGITFHSGEETGCQRGIIIYQFNKLGYVMMPDMN